MGNYHHLRNFSIFLLVVGVCLGGFALQPVDSSRIPDKPKMVLIKGGTFIMGQKDGEGDEKPVHAVVLDDFYMGKYELTVGEYKEFCKATNRTMPQAPEWGWIDNHPIMNTSWNDAVAYIRMAQFRTRRNLPTAY